MSYPFKVGSKVSYDTNKVDMEYYERGYGVMFETGRSTITSIRYIVENGMEIDQSQIVEQTGSTVIYKNSLQCGIATIYTRSVSKICRMVCVMEDGNRVEPEKIFMCDGVACCLAHEA